MNLPLKRQVLAIFLGALLLPFSASAQAPADSLAITVTPPLFQVTQSPGTDWRSLLRVVNSNSFDITVSVKVQDFHPNGETGNPEFEENTKGAPDDSHRMSGWIETPASTVTIKHSTTAEIPFTVHVPAGADPGGHYAAIIVGTVAAAETKGSGSGVSSAIASLVLLRVPGEVVEKGEIRDFYAENSVVQNTNESFVLRFENQGNVHLIPQGVIQITNMWGKVRGKMNINQSNTFGNVLPNSTRKFEFKWEGEASPFEFGRYKAEAILGYGLDGRQTADRSIYFWVVPWKPVVSIVGGFLLFFWFISWSVRRYIKNALLLERQWVDAHTPNQTLSSPGIRPLTQSASQPVVTFATLKRPLTQSGVDLRSKSARTQTAQQSVSVREKGQKQKSPMMKWLKYNRSVIFFIVILLTGFTAIGWYFNEVFQSERSYHVEQVRSK